MITIAKNNPKNSTIYRRGSDGRWCGELRLDYDDITGKRNKKSFYGESAIDVRCKINEYINQNETERENATREREILTEMERWLYDIKRYQVKPTSFDRLEQTYLYQVQPAVESTGVRALSKFDAFCVQKSLNHVNDKGYSTSTQKKAKLFFSAFFEFCVANGYVKYNPVPSAFIAPKPDAEDRKQCVEYHSDKKYLTSDEIARFKAVCREQFKNGKYKYPQAIFYIFMLNTGIRLGEALATRYSDIDMVTGEYRIRKSVVSAKERDENGKAIGRKTQIQTPKTKESIRSMKLNSTILEIINELKQSEPDGYDGLIIHGAAGDILGPRAFEKRFYTVLKNAEIEKCGMHVLRHTFASYAFQQTGGQVEVISKLLGHTDPAFTARVYVDILDEYKDKMMNTFQI